MLVKTVSLANEFSLQTSDFSRRNRTMSEPKRKSKSGKKILSEESDSDSARSRSLSAGRTQGRGEGRKRATTPSKCKPNHSDPDPDSSDDFTDSVSERVRRRRRVRRIREKAEAQKASQSKTQNLESIDSVDEETKFKEIRSETNSQASTQNLGPKKLEFKVAQIPPYAGPASSSGAGQAAKEGGRTPLDRATARQGKALPYRRPENKPDPGDNSVVASGEKLAQNLLPTNKPEEPAEPVAAAAAVVAGDAADPLDHNLLDYEDGEEEDNEVPDDCSSLIGKGNSDDSQELARLNQLYTHEEGDEGPPYHPDHPNYNPEYADNGGVRPIYPPNHPEFDPDLDRPNDPDFDLPESSGCLSTNSSAAGANINITQVTIKPDANGQSDGSDGSVDAAPGALWKTGILTQTRNNSIADLDSGSSQKDETETIEEGAAGSSPQVVVVHPVFEGEPQDPPAVTSPGGDDDMKEEQPPEVKSQEEDEKKESGQHQQQDAPPPSSAPPPGSKALTLKRSIDEPFPTATLNSTTPWADDEGAHDPSGIVASYDSSSSSPNSSPKHPNHPPKTPPSPSKQPADVQGRQSASGTIPKSGNTSGVAANQAKKPSAPAQPVVSCGAKSLLQPASAGGKTVKFDPRSDLIPLPDIPTERDTRKGTSGGYVYTTPEQFQADRALVQMALRNLRAIIAQEIFDTTNVEEPTNFLRRFWAATGVLKTRPLLLIVADLLNATQAGWPNQYNKWKNLTFGSPEWIKQLDRLQEMAIRICTTRAKKEEMEAKKKEENKEKARVKKLAAEKGLDFAAAVSKPSASSAASTSGAGIKAADLAAAIASTSSKDSNRSKRLDKMGKVPSAEGSTSGAAAAAATAAPPSTKPTFKPTPITPPEPTPPPKPNKSSLKPPPGRITAPSGKRVTLPPEPQQPGGSSESQPQPSTSSQKTPAEMKDLRGTKLAPAQTPQEKLNKIRQDRSGKAGAGTGRKFPEVDYSLLEMIGQQTMTHKPPSKPQPLPQTPPQPGLDVPPAVDVDDSGNASGFAEDHDDSLQVHITDKDRDFLTSPDRALGVGGSRFEASTPLPPDYDPKKPPPNFTKTPSSPPKQVSSASTPTGEIRRRVVIMTATSGRAFTQADMDQFRSRLEAHIDEENDRIAIEDPPISNWNPFLERNSIIVPPCDNASGEFIIGLVNGGKLVVNGHNLKAGWNLDLPEIAIISIRYELASKRDPAMLIEDPRKGIARLNRWQLEGKEITFSSSNADPNHAGVIFARVIVSRKVVELIQKQKGHLLISGGNATAFWPSNNGRILDQDNQVTFEHQ